MAEMNVGSNANLLKGAIDSHDTTTNNYDNRVDQSVTTNTTNKNTTYDNSTTYHNIYQAQRVNSRLVVNEQ